MSFGKVARLLGLGIFFLALPGNVSAAGEGAGSRYEKYLKSVVVIKSSQGWGTGFFITPEGLIITNQHLVGRDRRVMVLLKDERVLEAEVVRRAGPPIDLALLSTGRKSPSWLELARDGEGAVGDKVIAIGTPQGLSWTVSRGIVRRVKDLKNLRLIQTDTAINQGNSGGPLILVSSGRVVGVNTLSTKDEPAQGVGFAIAARDVARTFAAYLIPPKSDRAEVKPVRTDNRTGPTGPIPTCNVGQAQERLRELGFYAGPRDGEIGLRTRQAIKRFQTSLGLPLTGRLDEETCSRLAGSGPSPEKPKRPLAKVSPVKADTKGSGGSMGGSLISSGSVGARLAG